MKPNLQLVLSILILQNAFLNAQGWDFAKRYSAPAGAFIENKSVALSMDGSTYVVGNFSGTIHFDAVSITRPNNATSNYGYLLKLDTSLQPLWAKAFPERMYDVSVDDQGMVFVAGSKLASNDDSLAFAAKYSPDGVLLDTFIASGTADSWAKVIRLDDAGNCYLAGERFSAGEAIFGDITPTPSGGRDCFLIKLSSSDLKEVLWATYTGASSNLDNIFDIELDKNDFVYTTGNYSQNYSLGCLCYNGSFYTEKHQASTGSSVWKKIFSNGSGSNTRQLLSIDTSGQEVFVSASFKHTTTFQTGITLTAAGNDDYHIFMAKLNASDGQVQWAKKVALTGDNYPTSMSRKGNENILNGYFLSPVLMGDTLLTQQGVDAFLVETSNLNGMVLSAEGFSGLGSEYGYGLDVQDTAMVISGNSSSNILKIGNLILPGNTSSIYVARKGKSAQLPAVLLASISANITSGCAPLTVQFSSANSTGNPTEYNWLFPGGTPASTNDPNPTVVYNLAGSFSATLTVSNAIGSSTVTQTDFIIVPTSPTAGFTSTVNNQNVLFFNTSTQASAYFWDFGDGQTSTQQHPTHYYSNCGTYTVTLTSMNDCDTTSYSEQVTVGFGNPMAAFTNSVNGNTVTFTNTSTNSSLYLWHFGDGQDFSTLSENSFEHTYDSCGTFTVTLISIFGCGQSSATADITIGNGLPSVSFTSMVNGLDASFTNTSTNTNSQFWDFGDGYTSTDENPVHTYADCGNFNVVLTATNACGTAISMTTLSTTATPLAQFTTNADSLLVSIINSSSGATSYFWDFGDGSTSTLPVPPPHLYPNFGTYTITLVANNTCGASILQQTITLLPMVGTSLPQQVQAIRIFPNPNSGIFSVDIKTDWEGPVSFELINGVGQTVFKEIAFVNSGSIVKKIDVGEIPEGISWLRITLDGKSWVEKILINR